MEHPQSFFTKHPNNPIFGDEKIGTLFDIYVTPQADGLRRFPFPKTAFVGIRCTRHYPRNRKAAGRILSTVTAF